MPSVNRYITVLFHFTYAINLQINPYYPLFPLLLMPKVLNSLSNLQQLFRVCMFLLNILFLMK